MTSVANEFYLARSLAPLSLARALALCLAPSKTRRRPSTQKRHQQQDANPASAACADTNTSASAACARVFLRNYSWDDLMAMALPSDMPSTLVRHGGGHHVSSTGQPGHFASTTTQTAFPVHSSRCIHVVL